MEQFKVEDQFMFYLRTVGLKIDTMPRVQLIETKRAFYAAIGQLLAYQLNEMIGSEHDVSNSLQNITNQVTTFFKQQ